MASEQNVVFNGAKLVHDEEESSYSGRDCKILFDGKYITEITHHFFTFSFVGGRLNCISNEVLGLYLYFEKGKLTSYSRPVNTSENATFRYESENSYISSDKKYKDIHYTDKVIKRSPDRLTVIYNNSLIHKENPIKYCERLITLSV